MDEAGIEIIAGDSVTYDLEEYMVPAAVRKVLKIQKPFEIIHIKCLKNEMLLDHLEDEEHGLFKKSYFESMQEFVIITMQLLQIDQKEYMFKLPAVERVERVLFLKEVSTKLFKD